jgi:hypothetical protein
MSAPFDGPDRAASDLRVGEIRALRTFRLSQGGSLLPVSHNNVPWSDGPNTARCKHGCHTPAAPGCSCGFYAYGTLPATSRHAEARRVLAVVACWGRVVPGTRGLRAQHARIEALWVSPWAKRRSVAHVRSNYPSVALYRSRRKMIRRHQPTRLDSYVRPPRQRHRPTRVIPGRLTRVIPGRLTTWAENHLGFLIFLAIIALTGLVEIDGRSLIHVLLALLHYVT